MISKIVAIATFFKALFGVIQGWFRRKELKAAKQSGRTEEQLRQVKENKDARDQLKKAGRTWDNLPDDERLRKHEQDYRD